MIRVEDLIDDFRADADDLVLEGDDDQEDVFWTDDDLIRYIDDAQIWIARKALALRSILNLSVVASQATITLPEHFLEVRDDMAYLQSTNGVVRVRNLSELSDPDPDFDYGAGSMSDWLTRTGVPKYISLDVESDKIRLIPIPEANDTLIVPSYVLPEKRVRDTKRLEINNERYRLAYLLWMKKRAYEKQDSDVFAGGESDKYFSEFLAETDRLRSEVSRSARRPGTVRYGGL